MKLYAARDKDGDLALYAQKPELDESDNWIPQSPDWFYLDPEWFKQITFANSPQEVNLITNERPEGAPWYL